MRCRLVEMTGFEFRHFDRPSGSGEISKDVLY